MRRAEASSSPRMASPRATRVAAAPPTTSRRTTWGASATSSSTCRRFTAPCVRESMFAATLSGRCSTAGSGRSVTLRVSASCASSQARLRACPRRRQAGTRALCATAASMPPMGSATPRFLRRLSSAPKARSCRPSSTRPLALPRRSNWRAQCSCVPRASPLSPSGRRSTRPSAATLAPRGCGTPRPLSSSRAPSARRDSCGSASSACAPRREVLSSRQPPPGPQPPSNPRRKATASRHRQLAPRPPRARACPKCSPPHCCARRWSRHLGCPRRTRLTTLRGPPRECRRNSSLAHCTLPTGPRRVGQGSHRTGTDAMTAVLAMARPAQRSTRQAGQSSRTRGVDVAPAVPITRPHRPYPSHSMW
mmetsp:Transcript_12172/g.37305  ORF Transcript_12172/g.37305 Transcript_12172/m.37305 type:complete len:364 (+) Transcript_12172:1015-2106(+)